MLSVFIYTFLRMVRERSIQMLAHHRWHHETMRHHFEDYCIYFRMCEYCQRKNNARERRRVSLNSGRLREEIRTPIKVSSIIIVRIDIITVIEFLEPQRLKVSFAGSCFRALLFFQSMLLSRRCFELTVFQMSNILSKPAIGRRQRTREIFLVETHGERREEIILMSCP